MEHTAPIDWSRFEPSDEEKRNGMVTKSACRCTICGNTADRFQWGFQCRNDNGHIGDPFMGIFSSITAPKHHPKNWNNPANRA